MFFLISFVLANNYCVGFSQSSCQNICKSLINDFDDYYNEIPTNEQLNINDDNNTVHDIYISNDVDYYESKHNLIFCNQSIQLMYRNPQTIKIKDHIYADSKKILDNISILFQFSSSNYYYKSAIIEIETDQESKIKPFTLQTTRSDTYILPKFCTEYFPEKLISITGSNKFLIYELSDNVQKLFSNFDQLQQKTFTYYCLSDKETKCGNYVTDDTKYINYASEINQYPCVLIVDSSKPQILITDPTVYSYNIEYVHIIALAGSDITYYPRDEHGDGDFYVILHPNSIEMHNLYFEGAGSFAISVASNISLLSTTNTNNNDFTLKTRHPLKKSESYIHAISEDLNFELENKIHISDYSLFHGPKCLSGLFDGRKFISDEELIVYNVTSTTLKETEFDYVTYYFDEGNHEIPTTWKSSCRFEGINPNKTNFIFNDVYSYNGYKIDNFIDVNFKPSSNLNRITIKPSRYFYLSSFGNIYMPKYAEKYTIVVDHDFIMRGSGPSSDLENYEVLHDQCRIVGNGTIRFQDSYFMDQVREYCQIDENVTLEQLKSYNIPSVYACVGQSDAEKCKKEAKGADSLTNYDWIWLRNLKTRSYIYSIQKTFVTDKLNLFDQSYDDLTLTAHSIVTIPYYHYSSFTLYKNGISSIRAQNKTAKLTILFDFYKNYQYDPDYSYIFYYQQDLYLHYEEPPTEIDLQINFYYEMAKLRMMYYKNFVDHCIKLSGKCQIFIREPYKTRISIFDNPNSISFPINPDNDYRQICISNEPVESYNLNDFVLCSNYDDFKQLDTQSTSSPNTYVYLDLSLDLNSNSYKTRDIYFYNSITASINLPENVSFHFCSSYFKVFTHVRYDFNYNSDETKFIFDIKDHINLDYISMNSYTPSIEFTSSKNSVEIFASPMIRNIPKDYKITVPDNLIIYSAVPPYLNGLFGTKSIEYSMKWNYYHLSEEGRSLYGGSIESTLFTNFENDSELQDKFVLSVGKNDNLTIPTKWTSNHTIYILQGDYDFQIHQPLNLTYSIDGITLNHQFKIIAGYLNISVPELFIVDAYFPTSYISNHLIYIAKLDCSQYSKTKLYTGSMDVYDYGDIYDAVKLYNYDDLTVISKNSGEQYDLQRIIDLNSEGTVKYRFDYSSICYCTDYDCNSKCSGKYFRIKDFTGFLQVTQDYPELPIEVFNNFTIPYSTGARYILNPKNENITIELPYSPELMTTSENQTLQFNYTDSTYIEIINKSYVEVNLDDSLSIFFYSNTNSSIKFSLDSNVFVSIQSNIDNYDFTISVDKNSYHLYTEDFETYESIFNGALESYVKVCAYDGSAKSLCSFTRNEYIENVFTDPFLYQEVEIALTSSPPKIHLPTIATQIKVNILPTESSILELSTATNLQINPDSVIINEYWKFEGDRKVLIIDLGPKSTLSVNNEMTTPIILQLTDIRSTIDLRDFDIQNKSLITLRKTGDEPNEITVYGNDDLYNNFINNINYTDDISIIHNGTQKYLCICNNSTTCKMCKEGLDGLVSVTNSIKSDPGEDSKIRVFCDYEMNSNLFNNEHDVYINRGCNLSLTHVNTVNQNIEQGLKVDNLKFINGSNLILKANDLDINIEMREEEQGPNFTIEVESFLRLNVTNFENKRVKSSLLHVQGYGELNSYDYPFGRIRSVRTVKVIKGVYIICNSREGNDVCSYESAQRFKRLGHHDFFQPGFDPNSKILVFLDSYTSDIKVRTSILHNQRIQFVRNPSKSLRLLEGQNRLILESNTEILSSENSTELFGEEGGASFNNSDSDLFVVGFDENITIKQEGNVTGFSNPITIQPMNDKATIIIDDSVDLENQKLKIETENETKLSITLITNKNITSEEVLDKFIEADKTKVSISIGEQSITKTNKLPVGVIAGIAVGGVVVVAVIIITVLFVIKYKKEKETKPVISDDNMDFSSDSTF